jgi:hypothetical protein
MNKKLITIAFIILALALIIVPASAANGSIYIKSLSRELNLEIYLDGEHVGRTTHLIEDIKPGTYEMYIEHNGHNYVPIAKTITIEDGMEYYEEIKFERQGTLAISSEPSEAYIFVNGTLVEDTVTNTMVFLPYGIYEITVAKDGYTPSTQVIDVSVSNDYQGYYNQFLFTLEEEPDYIVSTTDVTSEEDVSESTETSKESPGFTGMVSIVLLGCVGFLLKKRTE